MEQQQLCVCVCVCGCLWGDFIFLETRNKKVLMLYLEKSFCFFRGVKFQITAVLCHWQQLHSAERERCAWLNADLVNFVQFFLSSVLP